MADGVSAGAEIVSNLAENVASQAAPAAAEAATQFTPDLAAAENLSAAVGGGAEGAFADDIMGDFQPEAVLKNMDAILPDVPSTQPIAPEMPPVGPLSTPLEGDLPVDSTPVEGTVPPVDGNLVEPPAPSSPAAEAAAAADGADAGAPEEPLPI
ncbi:hypothetical protein IPM65_03840 [Candidatus Roizmanbacteria bacterium]|nr:MAG: hypothetical protein IPM65_03840 [Candidatus Roizmanbacteria bacterium]